MRCSTCAWCNASESFLLCTHTCTQVELLARMKPVEVDEVQHWLRLPASAAGPNAPGPTPKLPGVFGAPPAKEEAQQPRNKAAGACLID